MTHPDIPALIDAGFRLQEPKVWPRFGGGNLDRKQFVSASEIGYCERKIWFGKYSPTVGEGDQLQNYGFAERGHTAERWVVEQLRRSIPESDWSLSYAGDEQLSFSYDAQSGTPDGLFINKKTGEAWLWDNKCIDPRTTRNLLPKKPHVKQVMQNIDIVEQCLDIEISGGILTYIDASNYQDILVKLIEVDEDLMGELRDRAYRILEAPTAESLKPEGVFNGDCQYCPFTAECNAANMADKVQAQRRKESENAAGKLFK